MQYVVRHDDCNGPQWYCGAYGANLTQEIKDAHRFEVGELSENTLHKVAYNLSVLAAVCRFQSLKDAMRDYADFEENRGSHVHITCDGRSVELTQADFLELLLLSKSCRAYALINDCFDFTE